VKTRLERLADLVADLASHRAAPPLAALAWAYERWSFVDGLGIVLTLCVLNASRREGRALHVKLDALVEHSEAPNTAIGVEAAGEAEIERARDS
jgi:low affinity Fe/Cu permease